MPTLTITKNYADSTILTESQIDDIKNSLETFVNTTKIDSDNIQASGVSSSNLAANSVVAAKLGASSVETAKINNAAVTADKIAAAVAGDGLAGGAGTALSVNVDDTGIEINADTLRLKDLGVTRAKMVAVGHQISGGINQNITATTFTTFTNGSVTLTTTGRPVMIILYSGVGSTSGISYNSAGGALGGNIRVLRDAVDLGNQNYSNTVNPTTEAWPSNIVWFDPVAAGTYTYSLQARVNDVGSIITINASQMVAYEL